MRITQTARDYEAKKQIREKANAGCRVCPCCGSGLHTSWLYRTEYGLFRTYRIDLYNCRNCGAEWESDAYRI